MPTVVRVLLKPVLAEMLGTFLLALTIGTSVLAIGAYTGYEVLYPPVAIGGLVGLLVYCIGPVSGCQLNPAVSLALFVVRKISAMKLGAYVIAQLIGAWLGFALVRYMMGVIPSAPAEVTGIAMAGEALGAFVLLFAITRVVLGRVPDAASGLVIGGSLALAISLSMFASGGVLNPAIALALGAKSVVYYVAPLIGAVLGSLAAVCLEDSEKEK